MQRRFYLINDAIPGPYAIFSYDTETKLFSTHIPKEVPPGNLPAIFNLLARKGEYEIGDRWSRRFVTERIAPPTRQNIGQILRDVGITEYDEFSILIHVNGRSCMDEFYLKEIL